MVRTVVVALALVGAVGCLAQTPSYWISPVSALLDLDDVSAALQLLEVRIDRFVYDIPARHTIRFWSECFESGIRTNPAGHGSSTREGGEHTFRLLTKGATGVSDRLEFRIFSDGGSHGWSQMIPTGYPACTWTVRKGELSVGKRTPLVALLATKGMVSGPVEEAEFDDLVSRYNLVVGVFAQLDSVESE